MFLYKIADGTAFLALKFFNTNIFNTKKIKKVKFSKITIVLTNISIKNTKKNTKKFKC